jgi:murein L,D-transpeptidase YafK
MADRNGLPHRTLAIALFLVTFSVCDVSAQKKPKQAPLGTPLGTPVQTTAADTSAPSTNPSANTSAPAVSPAPVVTAPALGAPSASSTSASAAKSARKSGAPLGKPLGTPLGTPMYGAMNADTLAQVASTDVASNSSFSVAQLQYDRVREARIEMRYGIKKLFRDKGLRYPAADIYLRVFKRERQLELWVRPEGDTIYSLLRANDICALSGDLGPKRGKGDEQVPEGFYTIDRFNPYSDYHLSLHVDYPNRSDQLISTQPDLGGDIMIHGGCNSIGCLALTDEGIKQLYWVAVEARDAGQPRIPVDIYPARLDDENMAQLSRVFHGNSALVNFWKTLKPGFDYFEKKHILPNVRVDVAGHYIVNNPSIPGVPTTSVGPRLNVKPAATTLSSSSSSSSAKPAEAPLGTPVPPPSSGGGGGNRKR